MTSRESQQIVNFDQLDETSPILIHSRNVVIHPSSRTLENDSKASSKIITQNVVDYSWEDRYLLGHLISYHPHTRLIAYVLSISNNYMIRILNEQHSSRCLIKDFSGEITDIAFSKSQIPYIASIDINGSVKVNKVNISQEIIECQLILHIKSLPSIESVKSMKVSYSRVMWCWHNDIDQRNVEESESGGTNISLLLGVVHGSTFEVMQIDTIESELLSQFDGSQYEPRIDRAGLRAISSSFQEQFFESESLSDLFLPYLIYTAPGDDSKITTLAISSDAAAFAVALRDGTVRFFTLDGSVSSGLKEAYSWTPFNGEAVWSLLFLDDCRPGNNKDSFWCHVVVGGAFNRELKLFRCDKWDCIQTVSFQSPITPCLLSAHIDQSARYLIMSDIRRKALYVLELDSIDNDKTKLFKNIQEFVLSQSLLSFDINTINSTTTPEGGNQIVIQMFTITKGAFQKMRVTYMSRGHRLNEILFDINEDTVDNEHGTTALEHLPVSSSLLTHVSSLPSANSSFQDPAIISTQLLSNTPALKSMPLEVPVTLQHLFSGTIDDICDRKRCVNDSGEESGDEASLCDLVIEQSDQIKTESTKFPADEDEESGFPLPPYGANNGWNSDNNIRATEATAVENPVETTTAMSQIIKQLEIQHEQMNAMTKSIQELQRASLINKDNMSRCQCKENQQQWAEQAVREVSNACHNAVVDQLDHRLISAVEKVAPTISTEISTRLDDTVRSKLVAVESVTRQFVSDLLHDKKFVGNIASTLAESLEKPLRAAYLDLARKEMVPALGRTLDRVFSDTREVLQDGIKDVMNMVGESNKAAMRSFEDKLLATVTIHQKNTLVDLDSKLKQILIEVGNSRTILTDSLTQQKEQISVLQETVKTMKESMVDTELSNHSITRGVSNMNINSHDHNALREQKINRLVAAGDYAAALNDALTMTDMRILLSVCTRVSSKRILSANPHKSSSLQSSSIMALIQQLSRDFHDQFDIKFEYLFDALLSLDTNEPGIRAHVSKVLKGVVRRLQSHHERETSPVLKDKITVLLRLVTSRLDSSVPE